MTTRTSIPDQPNLPEPLPAERKHRWKDWFLSLSLANLAFIGTWFVMLYDADHGYFNKLPVTRSTLAALAINLIWFTLLARFVIALWHRIPRPGVRFVFHLLLFFVLLLPIDFCRSRVFHVTDYELVTFLRRPVVLGLGLLLGTLALWKNRWAARWAAILAGTLAPLALLTIGRVLALSLGLQHLQQHDGPSQLTQLLPVKPHQPHVVWLICDETDYRLVFEQRPANIALPEFDRLRSETVFAVNAYPPGTDTIESIPALLTGEPLKSVSVASHSDLDLITEAGSKRKLSELPTVFDAAKAQGVNSAVVGWYHPYDRICGRSLAYCSWYPFSLFEWARSYSIPDAMLRQVCCFGGSLWMKHLHGEACQKTFLDAQRIIADPNYGLVFLHLPPPHGPGVYLPDTDTFTILPMSKAKGYFNNLKLADRNLGKLRRTLEAAGEWNQTWWIFSADHSWRQSAAFDGKRDFRIPFAIKPPDVAPGISYEPRLNTIITRELVLAILDKKVAGRQDLLAFLASHTASR